MRFNSHQPTLKVRLLPNGGIAIFAALRGINDKTDMLEVEIHPGEIFGGHTYEDWYRVGNGPGFVSADWLDV